MTEVWRDVCGYEGYYQVSNLGNVKSLARISQGKTRKIKVSEKILKPNKSARNHLLVKLVKDGKEKSVSVHRLVAQAFIPNPENKPAVDHIDTNVLNNSVDNLRWVTAHENAMNPLTRQHMSDSLKGHPCYYKHQHTEETKKKLSDLYKGKHWKLVDGKRVWY